jgi:hypothetical protein
LGTPETLPDGDHSPGEETDTWFLIEVD